MDAKYNKNETKMTQKCQHDEVGQKKLLETRKTADNHKKKLNLVEI